MTWKQTPAPWSSVKGLSVDQVLVSPDGRQVFAPPQAVDDDLLPEGVTNAQWMRLRWSDANLDGDPDAGANQSVASVLEACGAEHAEFIRSQTQQSIESFKGIAEQLNSRRPRDDAALEEGLGDLQGAALTLTIELADAGLTSSDPRRA